MKQTIRWGILGCGKIAHTFATDLKLVEHATLVAVGSRNADKAKAFAAEFNVSRFHSSYEALVKDPEVDVIYVATPHSEHHANTLLCLDNGKAVLCEKAFAVNSKQAKEMINKAREKKVFLMEALWTKFLPQYQKIQEILEAKMLGDITAVLVDFGFRPPQPVSPRLFDPALAGGTILDIGIYNVFMAMSVLGKPDSIEARMKPAATGVDEQCSVLFQYNSGAMAQLFSTFLSDIGTEAQICGTKGRIRLTYRFYTPDTTIEYYSGRADGTKEILKVTAVKETGHGYQYEACHVVECLQKGLTESPVMTHADTLQLMEVLDEIRTKAGIHYTADA